MMFGRQPRRVRVAAGVSIPYVDQGGSDGVPVVLIHGLGDSLRSYEFVQAHLPGDVRTLVPSLRGHGTQTARSMGMHLPITWKTSAQCSTMLECRARSWSAIRPAVRLRNCSP